MAASPEELLAEARVTWGRFEAPEVVWERLDSPTDTGAYRAVLADPRATLTVMRYVQDGVERFDGASFEGSLLCRLLPEVADRFWHLAARSTP